MKICHLLVMILCGLTITSPTSAQDDTQDTLRGGGVGLSNDTLVDLTAISVTTARQLDFDFSMNPYSLVDSSIKFSDDGTKQKLTFTPLLLRNKPNSWYGWTLGVVNGGGTSTFSTGLTYDEMASYGSKRRQFIDEFNRQARRPIDLNLRPGESEAERDVRIDREQLEVYSDFWEKRQLDSDAYSLSLFVQQFSLLQASKVDLDDDGKTDNEHSTKAYGGSVQWLHRWSYKTSASLTGSAGKRRTQAVEGSPLRTFYGAGFTIAHIIKILAEEEYKISKDYRSKFYIPNIALGSSAEWQSCEGKPLECENGLKEQFILTPFLDFRLPGGTQFRVGAPIKRDRVGNKAGTRVDALAQFGWTLGKL